MDCGVGCLTCDVDGTCIGPNCQTGYEFSGGICILSCNSKCVSCNVSDINICTGGTCNGSFRNPANNCECNTNAIELLGNCESK